MANPRLRTLGALSLFVTLAASAAASPHREATAVRERFVGAPVWVVGERHRVDAGHRLFGALVAQALEAGERVLVGLEIPTDRQPALDAALAGGGLAVVPIVIDSPSYRELLRQLGELGAAYPGRMRVSAIDAPTDARGDRDRHMAAVLSEVTPDVDRVLVLVGNLHALKGKTSGERLAALLEADGVEVASLLQLGTGSKPDRLTSGVLRASSPTVGPALRRLARLMMGSEPREDGWLSRAADGVILRP